MFASTGRRTALAGFIAVAALAILVTSSVVSLAASPSVKIDRRVLAQLDRSGVASFWIVLGDKADLTAAPSIRSWADRGAFVVNQLTAKANTSQRGLRRYLGALGVRFRPFWIENAILVYRADAATANAVAAGPEVARIMPRWYGTIVDGAPGAKDSPPVGIEWGVQNIRAPQVWQTYGDRGQGIVVATIDTGTQYNHPALVNQYRGNNGGGSFDHNYNWFDPLHWCSTPAPCDTYGHGTHTMGTIARDDGGSNKIGVAPAVKWIEADALPDGNGTDASLLNSGQWLLAPRDLHGQNPRPDLRPDIISNSWGIPFDDMDTWYQATVDAWIASGIFPAWAAGNEGPSCSSLREPGSYPESYTMGAYDINNMIASFSSRGPSPLPLGQGTVKPDIAAPGVDVRSSVPTNGYEKMSGTSMATPHVAATVALVWSEVPALRGNITATEKLLSETSHHVAATGCGGTPAFNNVWGHGHLDAFAAVKRAVDHG